MSVLTTDLRSHLALVTGASGGIGKATCLALASMGCSIAVHYHSSKSVAEELVTQLKDKGVKAEAFKADLTNYDEVSLSAAPHSRPRWSLRWVRFMRLTAHQVRSLHAAVVKNLGNRTILFNNAGLTLKSGIKAITEISIDEFEHTWRANCGSAFLMTQLCLPEMEKAG
jgi:3-oxoacyl-[acyl-carrier protein] reductase